MCGLTHPGPRMKEAILSVAHRETITLKWTNTRFNYFLMSYKNQANYIRKEKNCRQWDLNPRQYTLTRTHIIKFIQLESGALDRSAISTYKF